MQNLAQFLEVLDRWKLREGINDEKAAELMEVEPSYLSKIRTGKAPLTTKTVMKLERASSQGGGFVWPNQKVHERIVNLAGACGLTVHEFLVMPQRRRRAASQEVCASEKRSCAQDGQKSKILIAHHAKEAAWNILRVKSGEWVMNRHRVTVQPGLPRAHAPATIRQYRFYLHFVGVI